MTINNNILRQNYYIIQGVFLPNTGNDFCMGKQILQKGLHLYLILKKKDLLTNSKLTLCLLHFHLSTFDFQNNFASLDNQ